MGISRSLILRRGRSASKNPPQPARTNDLLSPSYGSSSRAGRSLPQRRPASVPRRLRLKFRTRWTHRHSEQKPLFRTLRRIPFSDCFFSACCGLPQQYDGSLVGRQRRGFGLVLLLIRWRQYPRKSPAIQGQPRAPVAPLQLSLVWFLRALRPSICREAAFRSPALQPALSRHQKPTYRTTGPQKAGHLRMHGRPRHAPCTKKPRGGILRANKRERVEPPTDAGAATDPVRP
mgnify:FL=1